MLPQEMLATLLPVWIHYEHFFCKSNSLLVLLRMLVLVFKHFWHEMWSIIFLLFKSIAIFFAAFIFAGITSNVILYPVFSTCDFLPFYFTKNQFLEHT